MLWASSSQVQQSVFRLVSMSGFQVLRPRLWLRGTSSCAIKAPQVPPPILVLCPSAELVKYSISYDVMIGVTGCLSVVGVTYRGLCKIQEVVQTWCPARVIVPGEEIQFLIDNHPISWMQGWLLNLRKSRYLLVLEPVLPGHPSGYCLVGEMVLIES